MKTFCLLLLAFAATAAMAQTKGPPELFLDGSGNPFPSGSGSPSQSTAPPATCVTNVNGTLQFCDFSGVGPDFPGPISAPQINVGARVLLNVGGNLAGEIATLDAAGGGTIMLSPGVFTSATQLGLPDDGNCVNLEGSGKTRTTLQLTSSIATGFLYKGFNSNAQKCILRDITIDANGLAPQACQLIVGKGWQLDNIRCINGTVEDLGIGDYLGLGRANFPITSIGRSSGTVTVTLGSTPTTYGQYALVAGVADSTYNGTFKIATSGGNSFTYADAGTDGPSSGGTVTLGQGGAGFYEVKANGIDTDSTLSSFSTFASLPTYGVHLYPTSTDSDFFGIVSRNSQINIRNDGGSNRFYGPHGYNFPNGSGFNATYTVEEAGGFNEYYAVEGDSPKLAVVHLIGTGTRVIGGTFITDTVNYPQAQLAVIESTAGDYYIDGMACPNGGPAGNLFTLPGTSGRPADAQSRIGFFPKCSAFYVTSQPNNFVYNTPFDPGAMGNSQLPFYVFGDNRATADGHPVISIQSLNAIAGDYFNAGQQLATAPLFRITGQGVPQLNPSGAQPTCSATGGTNGATSEGMQWYTKGSGSTNGQLQVCENLSGTYTWATQTTAPTVFPWSNANSFALNGIVLSGKESTWTPTNAATAVQIEYNITSEPVGCSTFPVVGVVDNSNGNAVLCSITVTGSTFGAHTSCSSAAMTASHTYAFGITTAAVGCTSNTGNAFVTLSAHQ